MHTHPVHTHPEGKLFLGQSLFGSQPSEVPGENIMDIHSRTYCAMYSIPEYTMPNATSQDLRNENDRSSGAEMCAVKSLHRGRSLLPLIKQKDGAAEDGLACRAY